MNTTTRSIATALLLLASSIAAPGCKQGLGERCQVDQDCEDGLVCNQAQQVCATPGSSVGIDAEVPDAAGSGVAPAPR